jgi:hypothetical protein
VNKRLKAAADLTTFGLIVQHGAHFAKQSMLGERLFYQIGSASRIPCLATKSPE